MLGDTVCVECFADDFLRDLIRRLDSGKRGECDFCEVLDAPCVHAEVLADRFDEVIRRLFKPDQEMERPEQQGTGEPLGDLLRDWVGTLSQDVGDPDRLVRAVMANRWRNVYPEDNYPDLDATWILVEHDYTADNFAGALATLRDEVLQLGHAFNIGPGQRVSVQGVLADLAYDTIKGALKLTSTKVEANTKLYRARLDLDPSVRANIGEFLPPPVKLAKAARANIQGERVWYLARESETARAELRPSLSSEVSVAEFIVPRKLQVCDLDRRFAKTSPFDDLDMYVKEAEVARLANALGDMFAKPIRPSDTDTEYLITQLLARMIRDAGFDGISYPSSQHAQGLNYILFDPTLECAFGPVRTYRCSKVSYDWHEPDAPRRRSQRALEAHDEFGDDIDAVDHE